MKFSKIITLYVDFVDPLPFLSPGEGGSFCMSRKKKIYMIYNGLIEIQTWNFLHLLRQEIKVPLRHLMSSTLSQTLPRNWRIGVDNHANLFATVHAKLGRNCRRHHRCEYFTPVWGSLYGWYVFPVVTSVHCVPTLYWISIFHCEWLGRTTTHNLWQ